MSSEPLILGERSRETLSLLREALARGERPASVGPVAVSYIRREAGEVVNLSSPTGSEQWAVVDLELPVGCYALIDIGDDEGEIGAMLSVAVPISSE